jgi:hypothetical protein
VEIISNPDTRDFRKADVIGAPVVEAGGFGVGVSGRGTFMVADGVPKDLFRLE